MNTDSWSLWRLALGGVLLMVGGCTATQEQTPALRLGSSTEATLSVSKRAATSTGMSPGALSPRLQAALLSPSYPTISPRQTQQLAQAKQRAAEWAQFVLRSVAPPVESGPGVVVCEPVASKTTPQVVAFGSGCTRWLHLAVAGQGEMGKTPLWGAIDTARREIGRNDLRLSKREAALLGRKLGLTHVITATIQGQDTGCTLSLQGWKLPSLAPVGTPVRATGTREAVLAQLPEVAKKLSAQLNVPASVSPSLAGATADDFEFMGRVPWAKSVRRSDAQTESLEKLSERLSVAGMLWVYGEVVDQDEEYRYRRVMNNIVRQAPGNVMALAASGWQAPGYIGLHDAELKKLSTRFPHNYMLAAARRRWHTASGQIEAQLKDAESAVAAAPSNPMAWIALGSSFSDKAQSIRNGRFYGKMNESEQASIEQLYPHNLAATLEATRLDPGSSLAWSALSEAATFGGSPDIADLALWKNIELAPDDPDAYDWGLEIYQPKWFSNPDRLFKVVSLIAARRPVLFEEVIPAAYALKEAGFAAESSQLLVLSVSQMQAELKVHPRNVRVWECLASVQDEMGHYPEAVTAYKSWLALEPRNLIAINNLGTLYNNDLHDYKANLALMNRAMRIDPKDPRFPFNIGKYYKDYERSLEKASPYFRKAMALDPNYAAPVTGLANLYWFLKNDGVTGDRLFKEAIRREPSNGLVRAEYALALLRHGRKAEAMQQAQKSLALGETDHPVFAELGLQP